MSACAILPMVLAPVVLALAGHSALAQVQKADAQDIAAIRACLKEERGKAQRGDLCAGKIADPCLARPEGVSTAGEVACHLRERLVWEDILNETHARLRERFDNRQRVKLGEMQRVWIEARKQACEFYWDFYRGTMASPMSESCYRHETAQRALYLLSFAENLPKR